MKYYIHTDGGSRGNPGIAASGYVVKDEGGNLVYQEGVYIGHATNNEAEYSAVIFGLRKLANILAEDSKKSDVEIKADSELLVRQMNGIYKVKNDRIAKLFMDVHNAMIEFKSVVFTHVRREQNKEADKLVNIALDNHKKTA